MKNSNEESNVKEKTRADKIKEELLEKYNTIHTGKQLYLRFPHKLPESDEELQAKVKQLSPLIIKAHKPRQNYARFCLIDFKNKEDRDATLKELCDRIRSGDLAKYKVSKPRSENKEFVLKIAERKIQALEKRKMKIRLKRDKKNAKLQSKLTSSIVMWNLPLTASVAQIREVFPNAVDIQIKSPKGKLRESTVGSVTFPSTNDARIAKSQKLCLSGRTIGLGFNLKPKKNEENKI